MSAGAADVAGELAADVVGAAAAVVGTVGALLDELQAVISTAAAATAIAAAFVGWDIWVSSKVSALSEATPGEEHISSNYVHRRP